MLTVEQIRAARALLDWSQSDLADKAGLSQTGIARIENGTNQPNSKTLLKIEAAFTRADIEFLGTSGLRKRSGEIKTYRQHEGFVNFLDDVYDVVQKNPDTKVVVNNVAEDQFLHWEGDFATVHEKRMREIGARYQIVVKEGDRNFTASEYAEYRWADSSTFSYISYYIYGDRTALIDFGKDDVVVYVIHSNAIADFYREEFDKVWNRAKRP